MLCVCRVGIHSDDDFGIASVAVRPGGIVVADSRRGAIDRIEVHGGMHASGVARRIRRVAALASDGMSLT